MTDELKPFDKSQDLDYVSGRDEHVQDAEYIMSGQILGQIAVTPCQFSKFKKLETPEGTIIDV